jgi:NAD+-dependent protein deacetylase sirtuin 6
MADEYNSYLKPGAYKGKCGAPEVVDSDSELQRKTALLAEWIREAKYVVAHTGAGISTSVGINDFRGPNGVWTRELQHKVQVRVAARARKRRRSSSCDSESQQDASPTTTTSTTTPVPQPESVRFEHAIPSKTHMALVALHRSDKLKYVVTQNVDGLHLASGLPHSALAELHGNVFREMCEEVWHCSALNT